MDNGKSLVETEISVKQSLAIANKVVEAIEADERITSSCSLSSRALRDHLPEICQVIIKAIAPAALVEVEQNNLSLFTLDLGSKGNKHGYVRSVQEFNPEELVREFFLLKQVIIRELKPQLSADPETTIEKISAIDLVINRLMENSFQSYVDVRQRQLEDLRQQIFLTKQELTRLVAGHQESLSYLVHEIKNPLTSIIGYSDLFLRQQQQSDPISNLEHIQQVLQQGRKVLRLINDTNEISFYQRGNFPIRKQPVDVCALLENITLGLKSSIEAKQLKLVTSCNPHKLKIFSDSLRIQQIITNLLINAIRYTHQGKITLSCQAIDSHLLEIKIADTGIGISDAEQEHIFKPYFRGQNSSENAADGVGFGLAIVDRLVTTLGGSIELNSELNVGSVFIVTIPLC